MKSNKLLLVIITLVLILGVTACSKKKFDINSNPNDITESAVTPALLLPATQQSTSDAVDCNWWWMSWWMGHGARSGSFQSLNEEETYSFTNDFHAADVWDELYKNANNYSVMIDRSVIAGSGTYEAIGRIMKSHNMALLVDVYNNIPYSEAFKGTAVPTPKYDKGVDVYNAIFADLDSAIALLNNVEKTSLLNNPGIATSDLIYNGNTTSWKKFANTLRLRMLIHLHNGITTNVVAPGVDVAAQMAKITTDGFLMEGESAHLQPGFSGSKPAPYYRRFHTTESGTGSQRDFLRASEYAIDYYAANSDQRVGRFYVPSGAAHAGIPFGTPSGTGVPTGSELSTVRGVGLIPNGASSRAWILTSVESLLLQAEARQRGFLTTGATADTLLKRGIRESFVWLGLTTAIANNYITANATWPDVDYNAPSQVSGEPGGGLYTIISQKWFALNSIAPFEIWSDYRRTGIRYGAAVGYTSGPTLSVDPNRTATSIPKRLFYPQSEYNYNASNVKAEGEINVFTGKVWWDLN